MNDLGSFLTTKCVFTDAEPLYRQALAIDEAAYGATHPWQAALANYSRLLQAMGLVQEDIARRLQDVAGSRFPQ
jgi:hypothetical protein